MSRFEFKTASSQGASLLSLMGAIDEDVDFSKVTVTGNDVLQLNLNQVKSINSCGIREWMKWISGMGTQFREIQFVECPKVIVDQINMVQGFLPTNGRVSSFYVPFYSEESEEEKSILYSVGKEFQESGDFEHPDIKDSEGHSMDIDVVEAKYFRFLKR